MPIENKSLQIPIPPAEADLETLHRYILTLSNWLRDLFIQGLQMPSFTQTEIDAMTAATQAGKLFFNSTTGKGNIAEIDPDSHVLSVEEIATV